jgi:uncharacterized protein (TIGR00661 family)
MRAYFAPCGIGLGHVGRNVPISRRLIEQRKAQVLFSTYEDGIPYVENERLPLAKAPAIGVRVKPDGSIDFRQTLVNPGPFLSYFTLLKQVNFEIQTMQRFNPDVVISDSRVSPIVAAKILQKPRICILNQFLVIIPRRQRFLRLAKFADNVTLRLAGKVWTSANVILIPDFPEPYTISSGNLNIPKTYNRKIKLIGPILAVQPDQLPSQQSLRKKLNLPEDKPVIFVPISGPTQEKAFLIETVKHILSDFPADYEVVASLGYPRSTRKPTIHGNVRIYDWIPNRFEYLKASDIVVGRAGHGTITQSMCYGKPMILVPTPNHTEQINNARQARKIDVAKILKQEGLNKLNLLENIRQMLDGNMSNRLKQIQRDVLAFNGLQNAVDTVVECAQGMNK